MTTDPFYKAHWRNIEPVRMSAYRDGFGWDAATEHLFRPAEIAEGHSVADFGCGPGKIAVELAKRVGPGGHVHALDINDEFLRITRENAAAVDVADRVTTHQSDGASLPLANASLDRVTARNAIMYVDDAVDTLKEFLRVLRPGGLAHAIEGDWFMMVAEPVEHDLWRDFVKAASHACKSSDMGRKLYGAYSKAGFRNINVSVTTNPDVAGRLLGMIRNLARYAQESGEMDLQLIDEVVLQLEKAREDGSYLVVVPQFVVTAQRPD